MLCARTIRHAVNPALLWRKATATGPLRRPRDFLGGSDHSSSLRAGLYLAVEALAVACDAKLAFCWGWPAREPLRTRAAGLRWIT